MLVVPQEWLERRRAPNLDDLRVALRTLSPDERRLLLRYYQDEQKEQRIQSRKALCEELGISMSALRVRVQHQKHKVERLMAHLVEDAPTAPAKEPNPVSPAPVLTQTNRQAPPLDRLRHVLQTYFPVLYARVLQETLADLREEHSAALAEGHRVKARRILLQGYGALAAAAICQLGFSLRGRIAALWKARSPK